MGPYCKLLNALGTNATVAAITFMFTMCVIPDVEVCGMIFCLVGLS